MKFSIKLLLLLVIINLTIGASFSYYIYVKSRATLETEITNRLEDKTVSSMNKIDQMLFERYADIQVISNLPKMITRETTSQERTTILLTFRNIYKTYASLSYFDNNRTRIADTSGLSIGEKSTDNYIDEVLQGKVSAGSEVEISSSLNIPIIYFAAPVRDENEEIYGFVASRMALSKMNDILISVHINRWSGDENNNNDNTNNDNTNNNDNDNDDNNEDDDNNNNNEEIDLIDKNGLILFSTHDRKGVLKDKIEIWEILTEKSKNVNQGNFITNINNEENIVTFAKEPGYLDFKGNDWMLITHIPTKIAFAPVYDMIYHLGLTLSVILFLFITLVIYISKKMLKPLEQLHNVTQEIGRGNFKVRANINTKDEFQELGDSFNRTIEQLEKIDEERKQIDSTKTRFLSITSHELRSPMTPMQAQLQMLQEGYLGNMNKKQKKAVDIVYRNTQRLDKIIVDFLEISRIEAARLKFNFIKVNLSDYIKQLVEEMKGFMPEKKIQIIANVSKLPYFEVDPDRVMQVLRNLLNNAIKFTPNKGKIEITARCENNFIFFSVKDSGVGIKQEQQSRIFEPFSQAEQSIYRQYGGTGLGLAICRGIVGSQGGKIWFESHEGKGTTFYFTIPLVPIREMKPIRVLFSNKENIEKLFHKLFIELLGPIGEKEFENLKKQGLVKENVFKYLDSITKLGVITRETNREFKNRIILFLKA